MTVTNKHFILREFESIGWRENGDQKVTVKKEDFNAIQAFILEQQADKKGRQIMTPGHEKLTANNYVGILQTRSGTTIEILPKIDLSNEQQSEEREKEIFLRMLRTARNTSFREMSEADIRALRHFPLLEGFIAMFIKELLLLTRRGLARHYTPVEENLQVLKGKLLFAEHLRHNLIHRERFYVRYDEFSANRPVNRLLKSALLHLQRLSRNTVNQSRLRQARFYFDEVPESYNITADFQRARIDRTMPLYRKLLPWAQLFLQGSAPSTYHGGNLSVALLFPMERIFEDYVAARLRREWEGWDVQTQESKHYLVQENNRGKKEFRLKPDIVARHHGKLCILDTKWKQLDDKDNHCGISQADLYQMFAYGKKYQEEENITPELYLLYPYNQQFTESISFHYDDDLQLICAPVNLVNDKAPILATADMPPIRAIAA